MFKNPQIDAYLKDGCGRCKLYKTAQCKVHRWSDVLLKLREIVLDCNLEEELKWSQPCYTLNKKNVLIIAAFNDFSCISFLKGTLLQDEAKLLVSPGENSQSVKFMKFTNVQDVVKHQTIIKEYIFEAIEVEKNGIKVVLKKPDELVYPDELLQKMKMSANFKKAFEVLTPGRKRGYIIHFTKAKQSKTRIALIDKFESKIMQGKGLMD